MTQMIEETIEHLDHDPPCEYQSHRTDSPVVWVVYYRNPLVCGCEIPSAFRLFCEPCWTYRNTAVVHTCPFCGHNSWFNENILKIEPYRRG